MSEHAVIVHLPLSDGDFGKPEERESLFALDQRLEEAVERSGAGEFDGNEFGSGECVFYIYGPDADRLFEVVEPLLKGHAVAAGGYAIKRYGAADDSFARETRVELG